MTFYHINNVQFNATAVGADSFRLLAPPSDQFLKLHFLSEEEIGSLGSIRLIPILSMSSKLNTKRCTLVLIQKVK